MDKIFETLSLCAALHPPPSSSSSGGGLFGLDPDSMVYADADGNLVGGGMDEDDDGIETMTAEEEAAGDRTSGRVRSDFVGNTRKGPY